MATQSVQDGEQSEPVFAQSGSFVTSGAGIPATEDGMTAVILGMVIGAIGGLMGGLILSHLTRYVGYLFGRHLTGGRWVLIGTLAGAAMLGAKAWLDSRRDF